MSEASPETTSTRVPSLREVRIVNWPLRDEPLPALAVGACCAIVGVVAGMGASSWAMGFVSALCLLLAYWKLWIPVTCELGPAGIAIIALRRRRLIPWRQIECVQCVKRGVLIGSAKAAGWARGWHSLYLPWRYHPELVAEFLERHGGAAREAVRVPETALR